MTSTTHYSRNDDVKKVLKSTGWGFGLAVIGNLSLSFAGTGRLFPVSIITFHFALTTLGLIGLRLVAISIYIAGTHQKSNLKNVLIFGSGDSGIITKNALQQDQKGKYRVVAFADDNANRWDKKLQNIPIISPLKSLSESDFSGRIVALYCSTDAVIPDWAWMLVTSHLTLLKAHVLIGSQEEVRSQLLIVNIDAMDPKPFVGARIVIKGCSEALETSFQPI
mgnify:CR=1 FL=1